jgi:hypothetical protein
LWQKSTFQPPTPPPSPSRPLCYFLVTNCTLWPMYPKNKGFQCGGCWTFRIISLYSHIMLWNIVVRFILIIGGGGAQGTILFCNKLINWPRKEKNLLKVKSLDNPWKGNFHFVGVIWNKNITITRTVHMKKSPQ